MSPRRRKTRDAGRLLAGIQHARSLGAKTEDCDAAYELHVREHCSVVTPARFRELVEEFAGGPAPDHVTQAVVLERFVPELAA